MGRPIHVPEEVGEAVAIFAIKSNQLVAVERTTFAAERIREREDIQSLLLARIDVVAPDVLVVAEEFGEFEDANRRIDLLAVDRTGRLVVIELKRTERGGHMELQALRYAAMVRTMTFDRLCEAYEKHLELSSDGGDVDARSRLEEWLDDSDTQAHATDVRIVLVSADFGKEITSTVLWLNEYGLDIRCVRTTPYKLGDEVLVDVQQVIPLPEATDYQIQIRRKQVLERVTAGRDLTKYTVTDCHGNTSEPLPKRRAVLAMARAVVEAGVAPESLTSVLPDAKYKSVPGLHDPVDTPAAFRAAHPTSVERRWWLADPFRGETDTYVLSNQWRSDTEARLADLASLVHTGRVSFAAVTN